MPRYTTVLLDIDDTLLDFQVAYEYAITETLGKRNLPMTQEVLDFYRATNDQLWPKYEQGEISLDGVRVGRFQALLDYMGKGTAFHAADLNHDFINGIKKSCVPIKNAVHICQVLSKHVRLALVSNSDPSVQNEKIKNSGFADTITHVILSGDAGSQKPKIEFFNYAFGILAETGAVKLRETLIVGDSLTADIQGGKNAGLDTCWFNRFHHENKTAIQPDYEIHDLLQLESLVLEGLNR